MGSKSQGRTRSKKARAQERRRKERRTRLLVRSAIGLGLALFAVVFVLALSESDTAVGVTETQAWDLPDLKGEGRISLEQFEGKPTVAAFFASWCTICQRELPGFAELSHLVSDEVNFVGINTMNNGSGLEFARQMGIGHWPLARDVGLHDGRQLATNFGARGSPTTVLYSAEGEVVDVTLGALTAGQLAQKLQQFFAISG